MARIRSTHPEQWTDDKFVTCSPLARLVAIGVRNEADDNGVFEWNPVKLKMRLLPADNCDMAELLGELVSTKQVLRFTVKGKDYAIIRNFQKYQKPKKPTFYYPVPTEQLPNEYELNKDYSPTSSPPVPHQSGNSSSDGENRESREDKEQPPIPPSCPAGLNVSAWDEYVEYRAERRLAKLKPKTVEKQQRWLVEQGPPDKQQAIVNQTIRNNWQGLFEYKAGGNDKHATDSGSRTRGQRIHEKLGDIARRDLEARAAAGGNGGGDGEAFAALPPQVGQRN